MTSKSLLQSWRLSEFLEGQKFKTELTVAPSSVGTWPVSVTSDWEETPANDRNIK